MLKINPVITGNYDQKGLQVRKPDFFVSEIPTKTQLQTDVFQKQKDTVKHEKSFIEKVLNLSFTGIKKQNRYEQGKEIAANIKRALTRNIGGVSSESFKKEYDKITDKNVIPTMNAYNKISPKESLIGAICKESANSSQTRVDAIKGITDRLVRLGDSAGVQTAHYKEHFDAELEKQFDKVVLPKNVQQLDKISGALAQAIENKNSLNKDEKTLLKGAKLKDTQSYTTDILHNSVKKAKDSMAAQAEYDGWSCKLGEQIRKLWNSENQKELVHEDIDAFSNQIEELNKFVGTKEYNKKFKELFDVDYDPELIATYKQKEEQFTMASICMGVEKNFKESVKDLLNKKPLADEYLNVNPRYAGSPVIKERKADKYERNLNAFAEFVGKGNIEDGRKQLEKTMKDYKITEKSSLEEKYEVLQKMANKYSRRLTQNTKNALGKKEITELKREYDNSYYAAFGVKNDIAKRVADYRASQMFSELIIQDTILYAASIPFWVCTAGAGIIPTAKIAAMHSAADLLVYGSDRFSSKQGMTQKEFKDIMKWTAIDGATAFLNQLSYKGIEAITSPIAKMSGTAADLTDFALCMAADVGIDCGFEYLATGKVTFQGAVYSLVFSPAGYIIDVKVNY